MTYILTEEDLDVLHQQAGITGVGAGANATPEEMRILGVSDPMATDSFAMGHTTGTDVTGMIPDPNYQNATPQGVALPAQTAAQSGGNFGVLDVPLPPPAQDFSYLEDPYSNLSKTQRRMMAFSAIKDAGMALQGKEGNSYATMMADITARADMARKAKAAQQQAERDRLMQMQVMAMLGGGSAAAMLGGEPTTSGGDLQARISQLNAAIPMLLSAGQQGQAQALLAQRDQLQAQLDEQEAEQEATKEAIQVSTAQMRAARDTKSVAERMLRAAGVDPSAIGEGVEIDPSRFVWSRFPLGSMFESSEYKDFVAAAEQLQSMSTFANLQEILETGARLGTLSDADMTLLAGQSGTFDPQGKPVQTAETALRIARKLAETIAAIETEQDRLKMNKYGMGD